ncbi:MAG TPA: glycosyltransferase family 2 protein [Casimicrobiaceae bacterium]|nr:glycosyltransferase family 2 protein [Casimicrobiaceae bacterium]
MGAVASGSASLIDVVLPAYNGAGVIRAALESALAQDVSSRIVVVDDGSTDDSAAIARSYGSRVTVITQTNQGVSGARNTGLAAARAPYVALLDQDDVWQPGKLARQLAAIDARPDVGMVFTDMRLVERDGTVFEDGFLRATPEYAALERLPVGDAAYLLPESLAEAVVRFNFISPSTTLLRREALLGIGGFDPAFRLCDDADCWMRLLRRWRGIAIEDRLVLSLVWEGNASLKWDRLIHERIAIGEKAAAHPELFPAGAADYFRRERPISYHRLGILALRAGDTRLARRYFAQSLRDRRRPATLFAYGSTMLPGPLRDGLLRLKRAAGLRWSTRVE